MLSFRLLALTLSSMALLWSLESCTQPISPEPTEKPDTIKSYVRAIVTTPDMTNQLWEVRTPDTVSDGKVGFFNAHGSLGTRQGQVAYTFVSCDHNLDPKNNSISLFIRKPKNVRIYATQINNIDQRLDSLRTWEIEELALLFIAPDKIITPFSPATLRAFSWVKTQASEVNLIVASGVLSLQTRYSGIYSVEYNLYALNPIHENKYSSTILEASLTIDKYDREKGRISGRFSFHVIGSIGKEDISMRYGVFENVKLWAQ
jgi:hypothetical protein